MNHAIRVPTPFSDVSELAENFAPRVDENRVMLPHTSGIPEGEWVEFSVTLGDGTDALAGVGRCTSSYDNGEDREPQHRFDVVLDSLQLHEMSEVYFQRILMYRAQLEGAERQTGEVSPEELAAASEAEPGEAEAGPYRESAPVEYLDGADAESLPPGESFPPEAESIPAGEAESLAPASLSSAPPLELDDEEGLDLYSDPPPSEAPAEAESPVPPAEPGQLPSPNAVEAVLTRRTLPPGWDGVPEARPAPGAASGHFAYDGGLPRPDAPPRPALEPSLVVEAAPRPGQAVRLSHLGFGATDVEPPAAAVEDGALTEAPIALESDDLVESGFGHAPSTDTSPMVPADDDWEAAPGDAALEAARDEAFDASPADEAAYEDEAADVQ